MTGGVGYVGVLAVTWMPQLTPCKSLQAERIPVPKPPRASPAWHLAVKMSDPLFRLLRTLLSHG